MAKKTKVREQQQRAEIGQHHKCEQNKDTKLQHSNQTDIYSFHSNYNFLINFLNMAAFKNSRNR